MWPHWHRCALTAAFFALQAWEVKRIKALSAHLKKEDSASGSSKPKGKGKQKSARLQESEYVPKQSDKSKVCPLPYTYCRYHVHLQLLEPRSLQWVRFLRYLQIQKFPVSPTVPCSLLSQPIERCKTAAKLHVSMPVAVRTPQPPSPTTPETLRSPPAPSTRVDMILT